MLYTMQCAKRCDLCCSRPLTKFMGTAASNKTHLTLLLTPGSLLRSCRGLAAEEFPLLLLPAGEFAAIRAGIGGVTKVRF